MKERLSYSTLSVQRKNPLPSDRQSPITFAMLSRNQAAILLSSGELRSPKPWKQIALSPLILNDTELELWLGKRLSAGLIVVGILERDGTNLGISVGSYRMTSGEAMKGFKVEVPMMEQMKSLLDLPAEKGKDTSAICPSGANGYSFPKCVYCPAAAFSKQAIKKHTQGTVSCR